MVFPELVGFDLATPSPSAEGWRVEAVVSASYRSPVLSITVNLVQGELDGSSTDLITLERDMQGTYRTTRALGTVPAGLPLGTYEVYNVVLEDVYGCTSTFSQLDNRAEYESPNDPADSGTHSIDFSTHSLEVVDVETLPPDPFTWTPSQEYMNALTELFLGRPGNRSEMLEADATLAANGRLQVAQSLANSEEWAGQVVDDIYEAALDRTPDAAGRAYWVDRLLADGRTRDIAVSIYGSPEAFDNAGGNAPAFVDALYNRVFGRDPDANGRAFWIDRLNTNEAEHWELSASFWESVEFREHRVDRMYQQILQRPADPTGLAHWSERLLIEDDISLAAALASSDEFHSGAT